MNPATCMLRRAAGALLLISPLPLLAQPPMAVLPGLVVDAQSLQPVPGAQAWLVPGNVSLTATADSSGHFRIAAIPVGHYALRVAALGYDTLEVPELWLRAGKQAEQRVELWPSARALGAVAVNALAREQPALLGVRSFTVEQSLRWPATFSDPGRVVGEMAGVVNANDQANHLSIRGNSPNANSWMLEGVEIVSPNHTGNAGTASDLPTLSGGGVNMLSAQMLGPSQLLTGVLPGGYDNALGGILDMRLRDGNKDGQQWTAQAGLLGIDLSTEGPLGKGRRSSWLANYRYSTIGLLGAIGVDFGDEAITFQDLSFHVALPAGKRGELHLFGLGGTSSNVFQAVQDTTEWNVDKDSRNIAYSSRIGAAGGWFRVPLGPRSSLRTAVVLSATDQDRTEERLARDYSVDYRTRAEIQERKLGATAEVQGQLGPRLRYSAGGSALERRLSTLLNDDAGGWLLRPWAMVRWSITDRLGASIGGGLAHFTCTAESQAEPRAELRWRMRKGRVLAFSGGVRSQLPQWQSFRIRLDSLGNNNAIGLSRSQDLALGYDHPFNERLKLHAEAYFQRMDHVPVAAAAWGNGSNFSMVNVWDEQVALPLDAAGTATNTGIEATVDHHFGAGWFWQANGTLYNSVFGTPGHSDQRTRWDGRYILNLLGGTEIKKAKEDRVRTWGISGRLNVAGGMYMPPMPAYADLNGAVLYPGDPQWEQMPAFYRVDLRVYLKTDRTGRTGLWAIDLQNATNARNTAFRYFDFRKNELRTVYQLGLIPNLSYRIEF